MGTFLISNLIKINTPRIQIIINGIAIEPNFIKSEKLNLIPKKIIPNFKMYC